MLENHVEKGVFTLSSDTSLIWLDRISHVVSSHWKEAGSSCPYAQAQKTDAVCDKAHGINLATSFQHFSRLTVPPGSFGHAQGLLRFLSTQHMPCELPQDTFGGLICLLTCLAILWDPCSSTTHLETFPHPFGKIVHSNFWHNLLDHGTYELFILFLSCLTCPSYQFSCFGVVRQRQFFVLFLFISPIF